MAFEAHEYNTPVSPTKSALEWIVIIIDRTYPQNNIQHKQHKNVFVCKYMFV